MNQRLILRLAAVVAVTSLTLVASVTAQQAKTRPGPEARIVDPKALPILEAMDVALQQAQGLVATYRNETFRPNGQSAGVETTTLRLGRPNVYYMEITTAGSSRRRILASNGTTRFDVTSGTQSSCSTSDVAPLNDTREIDSFNPLYWSFYDLGQWQIRSAMLGHWVTKWRLNDPGLRSVKYVGRENVSGVPVTSSNGRTRSATAVRKTTRSTQVAYRSGSKTISFAASRQRRPARTNMTAAGLSRPSRTFE